ncbi:tetratricopeptide repeat protein 28-like protein [Dinothrombium tinctorium]|uniref:Tetratricopeptide repeat protein 28-like protein n=1 Tax=Dinothrombium tinctorium TaxID=1965070 RepID=A0A443QRV0_9ACAR|nr:tetratricopeptide repeat protein 28-like protein [Dinothrombium tinctorium]
MNSVSDNSPFQFANGKEFDEFGVESETESCISSKTLNSKTSSSKLLFIEKIRQANTCCQNGDYTTAVKLYTDAIALNPSNYVLFGNRSAAFCRLGKYSSSLQDAIKARELNPQWPKAYYRQGIALQYLGRHIDALAAFASGIAQDNKSPQLLAGFVETAMKSPLRATLEPIYRQLQAMQLDKSPFIITSVVGQEVLAAGHYPAAVVILESSLRIGTCSLKLRGSVYSALSSCYWALNELDKAIKYMQQDLQVAKSLGDQIGECRAHENLGAAYFSKGWYKEALASHRYQLVLAMKSKDTDQAASALTSLGHVYKEIGDYPNSLASHKQCLQLMRQMSDKTGETKEVGNVGAVYLAMGDFDRAIKCHLEHLNLAKLCGNKVEEAKAYSNLGSAYHYKKNHQQSIQYYENLLKLAQEIGDKSIEARAYSGLGHAARSIGDLRQAKRWHERQLEMALLTKDKVAEGKALSNLGIIYNLTGDYDDAIKLHFAHLKIAQQLADSASMARAYGNIGHSYWNFGEYDEAIKCFKEELSIYRDIDDKRGEAASLEKVNFFVKLLNTNKNNLLLEKSTYNKNYFKSNGRHNIVSRHKPLRKYSSI